MFHILAKRTVPVKQRTVGLEKSMHVAMGEKAIEAILASATEITLEKSVAYPSVNITFCAVEQTLYLRQKLFSATETQAGCKEGHRLAVCRPMHLVHEPRRISVQEIRRFVAGGVPPQQSFYRSIHLTYCL